MIVTAPTIERARNSGAGSVERPEVSRGRQRRAYRIMPVAELMLSRGMIDAELYAAHERFETDWLTGHRLPSCIGDYGAVRMSGAGDDGGARRAAARQRSDAALLAVPSRRGRRALLMSIGAGEQVDIGGLEEIGRACLGYTAPKLAAAGAGVLLGEAMSALRWHYGS